jgi:glycosyltransferase involved in cell wall biosynthesis/NADP-dependent 3-hydroxy acid dehydrogenase YdfG
MLVATKSLTRAEIIAQIWETMPIGAAEPTEPKTLAKLTELTNSLIDLTGREELKTNPFTEVCDRHITLYRSQIANILKDKVVLITGGAGFVGSNLIAHLGQFGVKRIVSVDMEYGASTPIAENVSIVHYQTDIRDYEALGRIFDLERPNVVFHLAAQRLPGLAETQVYQTISTNIFGTENIIDLCEKYNTESCIFSSTGKASRYYTPDVYAGSKKIAEWLFSDRLETKTSLYGIVRFTHVVENSPISAELDRRVEQGLVSLHAPDRFTYAQNITESVYLLLNALTMLERGTAKLFAVKNLGWPINTLNIALHKIVVAGGNIPLYFKGVPKGYEQHMFMGHLDLSGEKGIIPMINVLEVETSHLSPSQDTVVSTLHPFSSQLLSECVDQIKRSSFASNVTFKGVLNNAVKQVATSIFCLANPAKLLDILGWGIDPQHLAKIDVDANYYHDFAELILVGIDRGLPLASPHTASPQTLIALHYLQTIPSMSKSATSVVTKITQTITRLNISSVTKFSRPNPDSLVNPKNRPTLVYVITKSELGGAQGHVHDLIKSLTNDYEIHLIVGSLGWLTDKCNELGVTVHHLPKLTRSINFIKDVLAVKELVKKIEEIQPDIIHAHSGKPGIIARLAGKICNVPVVFTAHGWGFDPNAPKLRRTIALAAEKLLARFATKVICVSESDRQLAIDLGVIEAERVVTIHNGIDRAIDLPTPSLVPDVTQLIMVARFNKQQKDQDTLMRAIKKVDRNINVLFVGSGPDLAEAKNLAKELDILSKATFLGDRLDVPDLLAQSQIFVLSTHYEGLPISILEAMRAGLPIIATNVNGIPEQVVDGKTGFLVERQDVDGLAAAITTLVDNPNLRQEMGREGIQKLHQEFTIDDMVASTKAIYQSVQQPNRLSNPIGIKMFPAEGVSL